MNPRYLLDTNILSALIRSPQSAVADHLAKIGDDSVCTSIVVAGELRFGAEKRASRKLTKRVETLLSNIKVLPYEQPADRRYAAIRCHLETSGTPIGPNDMLIAAHALSLDLTLVTANLQEFSRVSGLKVENWLDG